MKKIYILLLVLVFPIIIKGQIPQGFSYQAVIRNSNGTPIPSQSIKVKMLLTNNLETITYYSEVHTKTTNAQGLVSLVIGEGELKQGKLNEAPWLTGEVYIKVEVDPTGTSGFQPMGEAVKFYSVPYALYANNIKEVSSQDNAPDEEPIFVVKNKFGQIIFAVYQSGVRMYVDVLSAKGAKGGFAIGGLSGSGKASSDYFLLTPDSARVRLNEPVGKGAKGGFAIGGLSGSGKSSSRNYFDLTKENSFIGLDAGLNNSTGLYNSFIGYNTGFKNTEGSYNIFIGHQSGYSNTVGLYNTFIGYQAGYSNVGTNAPAVWQKGRYNSYLGYQAGYLGENSDNCVLLGYKAGYSNKASLNTFVGSQAGRDNQDGPFNTFIGYGAGMSNTVGARNTFIGDQSGSINKTGSFNVYIGNSAGDRNQSGESNVIIGYLTNFGYSGIQDGGSKQNVIIGSEAAQDLNGSGNVLIGYNVAKETTSLFNKLIIENSGDMTNPLIYGDFANDKVAFHRLGTTHPFQVGTDATNGNGAYLTTGGTWTNASSKLLKDRFIEINKTDILAKILGLDLKGWFYKGTQEYHIGPFAEDFYDAFGTGDKNSNDANKTLSSSDVAGVSIIAIQELIKKNAEQNLKIEKLSAENEELRKRLEKIEKIILEMSK